MTTTLGIIGLGQIGASIGLVLRRKGVSEKILGHDRDTRVAREAVALGAIGAAAGFKEVASQSDILFLCIPLGEMHTVLGKLGSLLRPGAVIVETAPIKAGVNLWIQELLPPGIQHVGLVPGLSPALLGRTELGIKAAHDEL
ncbi:MAG TPA: prephenate dehydrogenase/arogenate dehydrogenase family protein, partial [Anaerolineales bacterium]|nr:prephenate dehydrogenase/arogenate dehydrogenase family protein [Anaerolineales bacterium]